MGAGRAYVQGMSIIRLSLALYFLATVAWPQIERAGDILGSVARALAGN